MMILYVLAFVGAMMLPQTGWFRCLVGIHVLPRYPNKVREIGSCQSYSHYICYRCTKEVIK